ncbi:MAG: hypothetical protein ACPGSD_02465 [Flavobacteriales bacterium]
MKKSNQIAILIYFTLFILFPISCIEDCGPFPVDVKVSSLKYETLIMDIDTAQNTSQYDSIYQNPVKYDRFALRIQPQLKYLYARQDNRTSYSFISNAMACSEPDFPILKEHITDIQIIVNANYDALHLAGSNVNDLFDVFVIEKNHNIYQENISDFVSSSPLVPKYLIFKLKSPPTFSFNSSFTINYEQNGQGLTEDSYTSETNHILP